MGPLAPYSPALPHPSFLLTCLPFSQNSFPCKMNMASSEGVRFQSGGPRASIFCRGGGRKRRAFSSPQPPRAYSLQAGGKASFHRTPALPEETAPLCHFLSQGFQQFPLQGLQGLLALPAPPLPYTGQKVQGGEGP